MARAPIDYPKRKSKASQYHASNEVSTSSGLAIRSNPLDLLAPYILINNTSYRYIVFREASTVVRTAVDVQMVAKGAPSLAGWPAIVRRASERRLHPHSERLRNTEVTFSFGFQDGIFIFLLWTPPSRNLVRRRAALLICRFRAVCTGGPAANLAVPLCI